MQDFEKFSVVTALNDLKLVHRSEQGGLQNVIDDLGGESQVRNVDVPIQIHEATNSLILATRSALESRCTCGKDHPLADGRYLLTDPTDECPLITNPSDRILAFTSAEGARQIFEIIPELRKHYPNVNQALEWLSQHPGVVSVDN